MRTVSEDEVAAALGPFDGLRELGQPGGSGECWLAERGGSALAVKIIVREHDPGRFSREIEGLSRLDTPRVMKVLASGALEVRGVAYPYLMSEFIPGLNVRDAIARGLPSDDELRAFVEQTLVGLEELEAVQIVHRDLKPENIILRDGAWSDPVVIDLGLCRLLDASFTVYPWAGGTWPYMAPEQLAGERVIDRTDIWALSVVASEVASGQHPFRRAAEPLPADWLNRLRSGIVPPGNRPYAFAAFLANASQYSAFRRPTASQARADLAGAWR